jgi:hypothetical protein
MVFISTYSQAPSVPATFVATGSHRIGSVRLLVKDITLVEWGGLRQRRVTLPSEFGVTIEIIGVETTLNLAMLLLVVPPGPAMTT